MSQSLTMAEKIWRDHLVATEEDGSSLLHIDRIFLDESGYNCLDELEQTGRSVHSPQKAFMMCAHLVPTRIGATPDEETLRVFAAMSRHHERTGVNLIKASDPRQGIHHVMSAEQGLTLPGFIMAVTDSHTTTHGALGALGLGLGYAEATHALATQCLWQPQYKQMRVSIDGELGAGVTAKDLALAVVSRLGFDGAIGHIIEYAGETVRALPMPARFTLCNMSVEAGARAGLIAPDATTLEYLRDKPNAPTGENWDRASEYWLSLPSDEGAHFDHEIYLDAGAVAPLVTWGTSPEDALPVDSRVPDPADEPDPGRRHQMQRKIEYMGLTPNQPLTQVAVDQVFIGSCTNGRLEDLVAAAEILRGRKAVVPGLVVPASQNIRKQAEAMSLDKTFTEAGFVWGAPGCSMCCGQNGELVAPGQRAASTTNRNFEGRQGPGARTHLMSPAMAAAAAVTGHITDARSLGRTQL
ncbi:MAG: isopropylmalate isomerase [Thiotrichales bacterium]|nr:isopropylmalate isomerase [Thiotrichales bacterium]